MDHPHKPFVDKLRAVGLRSTRQRLTLARLLFAPAEARHVTAESLHGEAVAEGAKVSMATVYNCLRQFTEAGLLREIVVDTGRAYFDTNTVPHHHFYYEAERKLTDIEQGDLAIPHLPPSPEGRSIRQVDVVIRLK